MATRPPSDIRYDFPPSQEDRASTGGKEDLAKGPRFRHRVAAIPLIMLVLALLTFFGVAPGSSRRAVAPQRANTTVAIRVTFSIDLTLSPPRLDARPKPRHRSLRPRDTRQPTRQLLNMVCIAAGVILDQELRARATLEGPPPIFDCKLAEPGAQP